MGPLLAGACRWNSSAPQGGSQPLVVSRTSNVGKLAGAIIGRIRSNDTKTMSVIGPTAAHMALKAVVIAAGYLNADGGAKRRSLAIVPERQELPGRDGREATFGMLIKIHIVSEPKLEDMPEVYVSQNTNVGQMAGVMMSKLRTGDMVTLAGMGAPAMGNALKATMIAQSYLDNDSPNDSEVRPGTLALVPRSDTFKEDDQERVRMLLSCMRLPQ